MVHYHPRFPAIVLAIGLAIAMFTLGATAGPNLNCHAYAQAAVSHQSQNLQRKCSFKGGRWSMNYNGHFQWCRSLGVKMANLTFEDRARKNALNACKNKSHKLNCNAYALVAVAQQKENLKLKCGFKGGRWTTNASRHRNWCRRANVKMANLTYENRARKNALRACKKKAKTKGGSSFIVKYCKKAANVTQAWRRAMAQACKGLPEGKEWPATANQDFQTCLRKGGAWTDWQNAKRKKITGACARKKRTRTFTNRDALRKKTRYGWLSYDVCSRKGKHGKLGENLFNTCGRRWAEKLCKRFGYTKLVKMGPTRLNDKSTSLLSAKADGPSTWWAGSRRICHGKCHYFTSITCTK